MRAPLPGFGDRYLWDGPADSNVCDADERVVVVVYDAVLIPWLSVQPEPQYIVIPGGNAQLKDAVVVGLRVTIGR